MAKLSKVIWALDPFDSDLSIEQQTVPILKALVSKAKVKVEPVHVLSDGMLGLSLSRSTFVKHYEPLAREALVQFLRKTKIQNLLNPTVIVKVPSSKTGAAIGIDLYARRQNAGLIVINSHGHGGLKRAFLGSFAETLALHSKTPVLISGPKTKKSVKLDHILFPTDFSKKSEDAFKQVQVLAQQLHARITLFHCAAPSAGPTAWATPLGLAVIPPLDWNIVQSSIEDAERRLRAKAEVWATQAKKQGLTVDVHFDRKAMSTGQAINDYAEKKKVGLIALASQSSAFATTLTGSIGRSVARHAVCPVLILRK